MIFLLLVLFIVLFYFEGTTLQPDQVAWLNTLGSVIPLPELEAKLYRKLALNACINPVAALYGCTNGQILNGRDDSSKDKHDLTQASQLKPWDWVKRLARETKEVYARAHPQMEVARLEEDVGHLATLTSNNTNSMLADLFKLHHTSRTPSTHHTRSEMKQYTEINFINGAIVDMGQKYNVPTPWHCEIIRQINKKCDT